MKAFDDFNKMFSKDQKSKVSNIASSISDFFKTKKFDKHLNKYIKEIKSKTKKSSIQIQTDLAMHILQMLTYSAVQLQNVPLLDVIYTSYIQMPGVALNYPISSKKHIAKSQKSRSKKTRNPANKLSARRRRNPLYSIDSLKYNVYGGGKLIIQRERVVDITVRGYKPEALEQEITVLPDIVEIIRGDYSMVVSRDSLKHGDLIRERMCGGGIARSCDRLAMVSCKGGGGKVVKKESCDDRDIIEYARENNIDATLALAMLDDDTEFRKTAAELLKEAALLRLRNELKKGKIAESKIELEKKMIEGQLKVIEQQIENKSEALKVVGDLIKSRNLTYAEVFQCGLDAIFDASYYAALTKAGIMLTPLLSDYFMKTTISYYTTLKENSDTVKEGEEFVVRAVDVLDTTGGGLLWMGSQILDSAQYVISGEIFNFWDDIERAGNGAWGEAEIPRADEPPAFRPNEGVIIPDREESESTFTFPITSIQRMIERIYMNGIELSRETKEQIVRELISWPAIVFYFAFLYHLYKNIQRERNHKKVLQVNASQGVAAAQLVSDLLIDEEAAAEESRENMIRIGAAMATGGLSKVFESKDRSKDRSKRRSRRPIIKSPLSGGRGPISESVLHEINNIPPPPDINLQVLRNLPEIIPPISYSGVIPPPPPPPPPAVLNRDLPRIPSLSSSFSSSLSSSSDDDSSMDMESMPDIPIQSPNSIPANILAAPLRSSRSSSRKSTKRSSKGSRKRSKSSESSSF